VSLHSPLPNRRGVELKFLMAATGVLGSARRARANRRDISADFWIKNVDARKTDLARIEVARLKGAKSRGRRSTETSTLALHLAPPRLLLPLAIVTMKGVLAPGQATRCRC
jgi:hypothetical protein